jgi:hypothetical protein
MYYGENAKMEGYRMVELKRRSFLQMVGAASLAPALPALPASGGVVAQGGTTAQLLWASIYKRAGSVQAVAGITRTMGISSTATQGVVGKLLHSNLVVAKSAANTGRAVRAAKSEPVTQAVQGPRVQFDLEKFLTEEPDVELDVVEAEEAVGVDDIK